MSKNIDDVKNGLRLNLPRGYTLSLLAGISLAALTATQSSLSYAGGAPQKPAALPAASNAQSNAQLQSIGVIVVTAQRRSQLIQSVPIAITAINSQTLTQSNVQGVEDYFAMTPNVSFVTNGSRDRKEISIRGVSNQLDPYADVRPADFAFYIDDFNVVAGTSNPEVLDMQRIEILRGPQGTYFGRNSVGGAINITTNKPVQHFEGKVTLGYSSFDTKQATLMLNAPVVKNKLAIRAAGQIETSGGDIHNINAIGGGDNTNYKTGRIIARATPNENFTNDLTFSYTRERDGMRSGVPTGFLTATWRAVYYHNAPGNVANPDGVGFWPQNTNKVNFNRPQDVGNDFWYVSDRFVNKFDTMSLIGVIGYLKSKTFSEGDVDGGSIDYFYETDFLTRDSLSGELRLQSTNHGRLEWSIGANAGRDTGATNEDTYFGSAGLFGKPEGFEITGIHSHGYDYYQAMFGQGTYHLTPQISFTVGGRYTHEIIREDYLHYSSEVLSGSVNNSKGFSDFSPRFNISYKPKADLMFYATISRGFKSGGVETSSLIPQTFYSPETLWDYELGTKFEAFNHHLRADLDTFYMNWKNVQEQSRFLYLNAQGVLETTNGVGNAASARSYGVDASVDMLFAHGLTFGAHGGYLNAKFRDYTNALVDGVTLDASGMPLIDAPKWTAGAYFEYRRMLTAGFDGFIRPEWSYRSKMLSSIYALRYTNSPFISPSYNVFNLRLGVENDHVSLILYAENIFDKKYYYNAYEKAFYSGVQVEPAVRRFGVTASYKF